MRAELLLRTLRDARRSLAWWSAGLVAFVALILAVWPSVRDNPALAELHESYPEVLQALVSFGGQFDFASPAGYLGAELFSLLAPLLLLVAAIGAGARAIAGDEEAGTLELLLAHPVSRHRLVAERLAALAAELVALGAVLLAALLVGCAAAGLEIGAGRLAAAVTGAVLLGLAYGALAVLTGAATGRRAVAIAVPSALAVLAYLVHGLAPLVSALDAVRWASPWYHYAASDALRSGLDPWHALVLAAVAAAAAALAPVALARRDLR